LFKGTPSQQLQIDPSDLIHDPSQPIILTRRLVRCLNLGDRHIVLTLATVAPHGQIGPGTVTFPVMTGTVRAGAH